MSTLGERLLSVHDALSQARIPHAFGGAIALAYCTEEPRGTRDLDVNLFVDVAKAWDVFLALPDRVTYGRDDLAVVQRDGQVRLWWDDMPIDLFFDVHQFHTELPAGVRQVPFLGRSIPVLGCNALVVFKALFNRTKDWADIEAVADAGFVLDDALAWVERLLGRESAAAARLAGLCGRAGGDA